MENEPKAPAMQREPVRVSVYIAAFVVAASSFFGGLALVDVVTMKAIFASLSVSLLQFAGIAFAAELARSRAWAPNTVNEIMDADAVITAAQSVSSDSAGIEGDDLDDPGH